MELQFLGGADEIGRSAVLVNGRLLLDYGMGSGDAGRLPIGSAGSGPDVDAVVASHGHLDHVGAVPALCSGRSPPAVHWTPPTAAFTELLARDTLKLKGGTMACPFTEAAVNRLGAVSHTHGYGEPFTAAGHEVTLYDAGHIPGSAHVLVDDGDTRLLYTGDLHVDEAEAEGVAGQRLVPGSTARPDADVVVCESTYADVTHDPRETVEARFARALRDTVVNGGTVVVPAFAIGRTQEVLMICAAHDIDCYVDGMGKRVARLLKGHPGFLRDPDAYRRAISRARFVTGRDGQRRRIAADNTVVVTTSGMLSGGPAMTYVPAIAGSPTNLVAFSGYQVEGTPGRELLETGSAEIDGRRRPVSARREAFDLSAHTDREGLERFLAPYRGCDVLCVHGDRTDWFAGELRAVGHDARAPATGERVEL